MTYIAFPCGDLERVTVIQYEGDEVCVKMPYGLLWINAERLRICE
jgi:hypothetical protein